jgi:hypothetical protein
VEPRCAGLLDVAVVLLFGAAAAAREVMDAPFGRLCIWYQPGVPIHVVLLLYQW